MVYHNVAEILTECNSVRNRLCEVVQGLSPAQTTFKPSTGRWSVAEILEHLSKVDRVVLGRIGKLLAELEETEPDGRASTSFFPFSVDSLVERAREQKFKSPEPALPDAGLPVHESLAQLHSSRAHLLSLQSRMEARDLSHTTFPHFVFGQLNIYQWLAFIGLHEHRHLKQIESVLAAPEFPVAERQPLPGASKGCN